MSDSAHSNVRQRFARAVLPALLHDVNNTTQRLVAVRAVLDLGVASLAGEAGEDLGWAATRSHEHGWLLGVIGAALGVDVAGERHAPGGLRAVLKLAAAGLAREERVCGFDANEVPLLARTQGAPSASALCVALGALVHEAGRQAAPRGAPLEILMQRSRDEWELRGSSGASAAEQAYAELQSSLPATRWTADGDAWVLHMPASWFEPSGERD